MVTLAFLQEAATAVPAFDWVAIFAAYGSAAPIILWMAYEILTKRKELNELNREVREMARASMEAMTRMAGERKS